MDGNSNFCDPSGPVCDVTKVTASSFCIAYKSFM